MNAILQLSESAFHEILDFVAASGKLSRRESLYSSLRQLAQRVLDLDEMIIGQCNGGDAESSPTDRCSRFDPVVSLASDAAGSVASPCASQSHRGNGCASGDRAGRQEAFEVETGNGRVVVCHRRSIQEPSLCVVSSARSRSPQELLALFKTLLPYVEDAFHRTEADPVHSTDCSAHQSAAHRPYPENSHSGFLTNREREVMHWLAQGKGCWEIGAIVGISERTVKFHLQNIYRKLNVVNRAQAVAKAAQINLLQASE